MTLLVPLPEERFYFFPLTFGRGRALFIVLGFLSLAHLEATGEMTVTGGMARWSQVSENSPRVCLLCQVASLKGLWGGLNPWGLPQGHVTLDKSFDTSALQCPCLNQ